MLRRPLLASALAVFALATGARAFTFDACDSNNVTPLALRILDLSKAQLRYIHWVKVWRHAVQVGDVGKALPDAPQLSAMAPDLRAMYRTIDACTEKLLAEAAAAPAAVKAQTQKSVTALQGSREAIGKLDSAIKVSEFKLEQRTKTAAK